MNLTIIIPVYNSSKFIEETLFSLKEVIRESQGGAIIINDNSKDNTVSVIRKFNKHYKLKLKIKSLINNNGAGYAKDYGIKLAKSKYFLVCDSDNVQNYASIKKLYLSMVNNNLDAAHFQKGFHFYDKNIDRIDHVCDWLKLLKNNKFNTLGNLLKYNVFMDNFMISKKSYLSSSGYPDNHGFDTQGLSINYLISNKNVTIVKDTYYHHRRFKKTKSYYDRESYVNRSSINWYLIYEKLILYKKDILVNFFKIKTFDENIDLFNHLLLKKNSIKNNKEKLIINNYYKWFNFFLKKKYSKLLIISSNLIRLTNFSDLSVYLLIRSLLYQFNGASKENDIKSFELLRNFYKKRDHRPLKEKLISKIKSLIIK